MNRRLLALSIALFLSAEARLAAQNEWIEFRIGSAGIRMAPQELVGVNMADIAYLRSLEQVRMRNTGDLEPAPPDLFWMNNANYFERPRDNGTLPDSIVLSETDWRANDWLRELGRVNPQVIFVPHFYVDRDGLVYQVIPQRHYSKGLGNFATRAISVAVERGAPTTYGLVSLVRWLCQLYEIRRFHPTADASRLGRDLGNNEKGIFGGLSQVVVGGQPSLQGFDWNGFINKINCPPNPLLMANGAIVPLHHIPWSFEGEPWGLGSYIANSNIRLVNPRLQLQWRHVHMGEYDFRRRGGGYLRTRHNVTQYHIRVARHGTPFMVHVILRDERVQWRNEEFLSWEMDLPYQGKYAIEISALNAYGEGVPSGYYTAAYLVGQSQVQIVAPPANAVFETGEPMPPIAWRHPEEEGVEGYEIVITDADGSTFVDHNLFDPNPANPLSWRIDFWEWNMWSGILTFSPSAWGEWRELEFHHEGRYAIGVFAYKDAWWLLPGITVQFFDVVDAGP